MGRWNVGVNLGGRLTRTRAFEVMNTGVVVGRMKFDPTHNRPQTLLEGVPSHHERFQ